MSETKAPYTPAPLSAAALAAIREMVRNTWKGKFGIRGDGINDVERALIALLAHIAALEAHPAALGGPIAGSTAHLIMLLTRERDEARDQVETLTQEICLLRAVVQAAVEFAEARRIIRESGYPLSEWNQLHHNRERDAAPAIDAAVAAYLAARGGNDAEQC